MGGGVQNRESPDFRLPEVGRYDIFINAVAIFLAEGSSISRLTALQLENILQDFSL